MGPGCSKSRPGGFRDLQNWFVDSLEGSLEGPVLVWTAILEVQGPVCTLSWGHSGASGDVSGSNLDDLGVPNQVRRLNFSIRNGKMQNSKIFCFPIVFFVDFRSLEAPKSTRNLSRIGPQSMRNRYEGSMRAKNAPRGQKERPRRTLEGQQCVHPNTYGYFRTGSGGTQGSGQRGRGELKVPYTEVHDLLFSTYGRGRRI
jgi:hypothetical protein